MTLQTSQVCLHHDESVRSCADAIPFTQLWMGKPGYYHLLRILSCTDNYTCLHHYRWENKVNPGYPWPHARSTTRQHRHAGTQGVELKTRTRAQRNVSSRVAKFGALRMSTSIWSFIFTRAGSLQNTRWNQDRMRVLTPPCDHSKMGDLLKPWKIEMLNC